jgi:hypothetical protein
MISTISLAFDLTYTDPITGTVIPRLVVNDVTAAEASYPFDLSLLQAKGYGVLSFNGDIIENKSSLTDPLIDLEAGEATGFLNLPLDGNGNVANGVYRFQYDLRVNSNPAISVVVGSVTGGTTFVTGFDWVTVLLQPGSFIRLNNSPVSLLNQVVSATMIGTLAHIELETTVPNGPYSLQFVNDVTDQFDQSYAYSGCTQTTADVDFIYDCEYGNSGTWSVSNATILGATEIVTSLNCVINYPSWTSSSTSPNPLFNPQVVTTVLPYPTQPGDTTPLATGTYSVSLSQQIQQTQASGLVVLYNNSVIREFAVSCAGSLCGLIPCMENLRAAHAAELVRNRISKYQVFVDNVLLYYTEAMNYKSCGELDKYRNTINLIQAQLDASGCDCACCDDNSYYWVANNSANSIIDDILASFQFRLYTGPGDPGDTHNGVQLGALWEDVTTGIIYRCIDATPGDLIWEEYFNPSIVYLTGADNGLSILSGNVILGGSLDYDTTIDLGFRSLDFTSTSGNLEFAATNGGNMAVSTNAGTAIDVTGTTSALKVEGTVNALDVLATNSTAGILKVQRTADDTVAVNLALQTSVDSAAGANGLGSSIQFASEGSTSSIVTTGSIQSVLTSASAPTEGNLKFNTKSASGLINPLTLNPDGSATLPLYGDGSFTGSPEFYLAVDIDGNVIESNPVSNAANGLSISGGDFVLGGSLDGNTTIDLNTRNLTLSGTTGNVIASVTNGTALDISSGTSAALVVEASSNAIISTSTNDVAGVLAVNKTTNNTVSRNVILRTTVDGSVGAAGLGSSIAFQGENSAGSVFDMGEIKTTITNATSGVSKFDFTLKDLRGSSLVPAMTINGDFSLNLSEYGSGTFTGTATRSLSVDASGNVIETALPSGPLVYVGKVTGNGPTAAITEIFNNTGATITFSQFTTGQYILSASSAVFTSNKTGVFATMVVGPGSIDVGYFTNQINVNTFDASGVAADLVAAMVIKVEIYP